MTTTLASPALTAAGETHASPARLIRAEIMKIRTTNTWWLFGIGMVLVTGLALTINGLEHHYTLFPPLGSMPPEEQAWWASYRDRLEQAALSFKSPQ